MAAHVLPSDWPDRSVREGPDGVWHVEPPLVPEWSHGEDIEPAARLRWAPFVDTGFYLTVTPGVRSLPTWSYGESTRPAEERDALAAKRLAWGGNAYRVEAMDDSAYPRYRVLGATPAEGGVRWVELTVLEFADGRSWLVGGLHRVLVATDTTVQGVILVAALAGGLWLTGYILSHPG